MPRVGLEEVTSPVQSVAMLLCRVLHSATPVQSVAMSAAFPRNWATLTLLPAGCFSCPRVEATPIT